MSKRFKMLGVAAIAAAMMAASAQAATVFDLTAGLATEGSTLRHAFSTESGATLPEPATMIVLGTVLLATFRGHRRA